MKIIKILVVSLLFGLPSTTIFAGNINYKRNVATEYAGDYCKIYNTDATKGIAYTSFSGRDCANFMSQSLIAGGLDFGCVSSAVSIGTGTANNGAKGIVGANNLAAVLQASFCFKAVSKAEAKDGDILNWGGHVGMYKGGKYAAHTTDHCFSDPGTVYGSPTYLQFQDSDKCQQCKRDDQCKGKMEPKCTNIKCETCDPNSGACQPINSQWLPLGRCSQRTTCNADTGLQATDPGGPMVCGDDTLTVGTGVGWQPLSATDLGSAVGVLKVGFTYNMVDLLQSFKQDVRVVNPDEISPTLAKEMPLLIIPSAGLYGMEKSGLFKASLESYVNEGGSILVMGQHYGYAYASLPGEVDGYGWLEDQMCFANSSYLTTWHPVLAGQTRSTPSIGVDGYFTKYPDTTSSILRRTANGQPDLIMYPIGKGYVIATSFYTDTAFTSRQASTEEKNLIRDIVAWAKSPGPIPEVGQSQTANLNLIVKNNTLIPSTAAEIEVYDPDRKERKLWTTIPVTLAPGESAQIPVSYAVAASDPVGIYHVKYNLMSEGYQLLTSEIDPQGTNVWLSYQIQAPQESPSGRFAVTKPPRTGYQLSGITYAIQSDSFAYINNTPATFTIKIWNNADVQRTITAKYDGQSQNVTVAPKGLGSITYSKNMMWGSTGLSATFYDETGKYLGSTFRNGVIVSPATKISTSVDKAYYAKGETVSIHATIQNKTLSEIRTSWQADVKTIIYDSSYTKVFEDTKTVTVQPSQTVTETTTYVLPVSAKLGTYTIYTYVMYGNSSTGSAYSRFDLPQSRISTALNLTPFISNNNFISFTLSNTGAIKVDSGTLDVNLKDPEGNTIYSGTHLFELSIGETKTIESPVSIPLEFGNYVLTYTQSDETKTGSSVQTVVPNSGWISITSDKSNYKIGDSANVSIAVQNWGRFTQEGTLTITVPTLGLTDTRAIVLTPSENTTIPYTIALPVTLNSDIEVEAAFALSGNPIQRSLSISILPVTLAQTVSFDKPSYRIRETVGMNYVLTNDGSFVSPLNATLSVSIPDIDYSFNSPLVIEPDKKIEIPLSSTLPENLGAGQHQVLTSITLPSGAVHKLAFFFTVPESTLNIQMPEAAMFAIGDTATISVENIGGLDTDLQFYVDLYDVVTGIYWNSLNDNIQAGASKVFTFQIPSQTAAGEYILHAYVSDTKTDRWVDSSMSISIAGLNAGLSVNTDKDIYLATEGITVVSQIVNGAYPVEGGNLHLQIVNKCDGNGGGGGGGEIPQSFHFSTWADGVWTDRGVLHYPNTFQTQSIWLSGYYSTGGESRVKIRHEGTGYAEIDLIGLPGEGFIVPDSAINLTTGEDISGLINLEDGVAASVLNNEIEVRWTNVSEMDGNVIFMVAKEGLVSCQKKIYWQTDIPVSQAADATVDLDRIVSALNLTGQFYLQGRLSSSIDQIIAESEYPFSIIDGDIGLKLKTDKAIYKSGEAVAVTGEVVNLSDIVASGIALELSNGTNVLYAETFNIAAHGSSSFSFATTADAEGLSQLVGNLSQSGNPLYSAGTTYEVSLPMIDSYLYGPETVGSAPFTLKFEVFNAGKVPGTVQVAVSGGSLFDTQEIIIPVNGSKLLRYSQQITGDTAYTATISGDVSQALDYTALFGEKAELQVSAQPAYRAGEIAVPYSIKNIGTLEAAYPVNCSVTKDGQEVLSTSAGFVLPVNGSDSSKIKLNLPEGQYVLTCRTTGAQASAQITVVKTGQLQIALSANQIYHAGPVTAASVITNTGFLDETVTVTYTLQPAAQVQTRSYYIAKGGSVSDTLYYDLKEGNYQLTATSFEPVLSAVADFEVRKDNDVAMALSAGAQVDSLLPATVTLANLGFNSIDGSVNLSLADSQGASVWTSSQEVSLPFMAVPTPHNINFNINPAAITPGDYIVKAELFNSSNQSLVSSTQPLSVQGANIQITQLPPYQVYSAGQDATSIFRIKNNGNQAGEAELRLKAYDLIDSTQLQWLMPGEEKEITFNIQMPIDLEKNDYFADYEFKSTGGQLQKGQVKYHLAGINIQVNAALDKQNYAVGETARLAITVSQQDVTTMNLYANVVYGQYENQLPFALNGSQTLTFDIPLDEITGQKLYYGIYTDSGRSLHLNSLYIYRSGTGLVITTDKQVYEPSEHVSITINSTSAATGTMTLTGQNYSETFAFAGSASKGLTLPANAGAGTYFINAELRTSAPEPITGSHPIDINGIQLRVTDAKLVKGKYDPTDTLLVTAKIQSNTIFAGSLRMSIIDPDNVVLPLGQYGISITSPDEFPYSGGYPLATNKAGMHKLMYSVYSGDMLLASGPLAFDVGDAVLLGISPDKKDYPSASEPVTAVVSMYGTGNANLEILVDDAIVRTEPVTLNGVATLGLELPSMPPGAHALKAVLKAGGLTSTKSSSFKYGSSLPDLAPIITPSTEIGPDAAMQFTVSVTNHGSDASSATTLSVFDGDHLIDSKSVRALNAADVDTISVAWNILGKAGDHIIKAVVDPQNTVIEFDENNNTAEAHITIPADTTPPLTAITIGAPKYDANGDIFASSGTVFSLIATDDLSGVARTEYRLDGGAWTSYMPFSIISEGTHTIDYRSQDNALNMETAKSLVVQIDTTPPAGNIVINAGAEYANSATVTLTLLCDDMRSGCAQMSFSNDSTSWSASEAYTTAKTWSLVPEDGTKAAYVKYIDGVGNPSAAYNASILLDTMSPTTTATPLGGLYDSARTVNLSAIEPAVIYYTTNGSIPTTSSTVYAGPMAIQDNTTLMFFAKDRAGNAEVVTRQTYTIDTQPPTMEISTLPDGSYTNNGTLNIAGIVKDDIEVQGITINDTATPVNADGTFNQALSLATGSNTITIIAKDTAGHAATDVRTIVFDQTAPTLIITNPSDNIVTNNADLTVTGAVDETSTVSVKVNSGSTAPAATDGTTFSLPVTLEAGMNTIEVTATDLATNSGKDKRTVTYDNVNPSLAVNSPAQDITTDQSSILLQGTVLDLTAIAVTIHHDGRTFTPVITAGMFQQQLSFATEKTYAITVTASDAAGNTTTVQRNIIYQNTPSPMVKTTLAYTGATLIAQGGKLTLSGVLKANSTEASIPDGKTITFTIGNGSNSQSCTGTTDSKGKAHCGISSISIPTGPATITAVFSGDAYYQSSFNSNNVIIFAYTTSGSFVIGDRNSVVNNSVTFWGAKWRKDNVLSGGSAPASFKGYAEVTSSTPPTCDGTWVSKPGSSSKLPASLPSYIAVLASSSITKVGSSIKGDSPEIVIVRVNQDYDMGRSGTGTVVGKLCQRSNRCGHEGNDDSRMISDDEHREHHDRDSQNGNKCFNDEDKQHYEEKERDH